MNKKGFTLIEVLAVVVLLGLLMGLLFPAVSKYIIGTRDNTYTVYEADMKTSAQNLMTECVEANDTLCIPKSGKSKKITLSEL
ncbi:MAG: prepilin-type N-terminal cleavage/methylation domain-containing protein, partial [Bacilli bacterium]|nr:prepilin-type N-terminal cleavage/methylation domain-containing protein [Bacilli bacterium]